MMSLFWLVGARKGFTRTVWSSVRVKPFFVNPLDSETLRAKHLMYLLDTTDASVLCQLLWNGLGWSAAPHSLHRS